MAEVASSCEEGGDVALDGHLSLSHTGLQPATAVSEVSGSPLCFPTASGIVYDQCEASLAGFAKKYAVASLQS